MLAEIKGLEVLMLRDPTRAILQISPEWLSNLSSSLTELHLKVCQFIVSRPFICLFDIRIMYSRLMSTLSSISWYQVWLYNSRCSPLIYLPFEAYTFYFHWIILFSYRWRCLLVPSWASTIALGWTAILFGKYDAFVVFTEIHFYLHSNWGRRKLHPPFLTCDISPWSTSGWRRVKRWTTFANGLDARLSLHH